MPVSAIVLLPVSAPGDDGPSPDGAGGCCEGSARPQDGQWPDRRVSSANIDRQKGQFRMSFSHRVRGAGRADFRVSDGFG